MTTVIKEGKYELTDTDFIEYGKEAAKLANELLQAESEFDQVKHVWKGKIEEFQKKVYDLQKAILNGYEFRQVNCEIQKDFQAKTVSYVGREKPFQGVVIEERPMTASELQMEIETIPNEQPDFKKAAAGDQ